MIRLIVNGKDLDLYPDEKLNYTFQVNDISDIDKRQTNFTDNYKIPKTPKNKRIFKSLGLVGDISNTPYTRPDVDLLDNGITLIRKGYINVTETSKDYKVYLFDGLIDFFKIIENKKVGVDLNLSEINHTKELSTIVSSINGLNYRYLVADYNGKNLINGNINSDYLVPSVSVVYLWNKIHDFAGYTYEGGVFANSDFLNLWITYNIPEKNVDNTQNLLASGDKGYFIVNPYNDSYKNWDTTLGIWSNNWRWFSNESKVYRVEFQYASQVVKNVYLSKNGIYIRTFTTAIVNFVEDIFLNSGDYLEIIIDTDIPVYLVFFNLSLDISEYTQIINYQDQFKELELKDFIREILVRFCLTAIIDTIERHIKYLTLDELLDFDNAIDWSDRYSDRKSENYIYGSYAQRNNFIYKYDNKDVSYYDSFINVSNENLDDKKDVFKSIFFAPEIDKRILIGGLYSDVFKVWERRSNNDTTEYEIKNGRYFLLRSKTMDTNLILESELEGISQNVSQWNLGVFEELEWDFWIGKYYEKLTQIINVAKVHKIELALSSADVHNVRFDLPYYFKQENSFYILNKLRYKDKRLSNAEFVRVQRYDINNVVNEPFVTINSYNGSCFTFTYAQWYIDLFPTTYGDSLIYYYSLDGNPSNIIESGGSGVSPRCYGFTFPNGAIFYVSDVNQNYFSNTFTV